MSAKSYRKLLGLAVFTRGDVISLLSPRNEDEKDALFARADEVRAEYVGDEVHLRGIIEISNRCACDCLYCGLRAGNSDLARYRMSADEILDCAEGIAAIPVRTIVLQSGEDISFSALEIADTVSRIKARCGTAVTLSLGQRDAETYRLWRAAGADRYLLKHETANRAVFARLKPDTGFDDRIDCLRALAAAGFQCGSGNMVGLPGQTIADIADDILLCRELASDMCSFGPFIPSPDTPLAGSPPGDVELSLITIAVARIVLRRPHMPANTALGTLDPDAQRRALLCGANVIMPNFTPFEYRSEYRIYPKEIRNDGFAAEYDKAVRVVNSAGRFVGAGAGHALKL